MGNGVKHTVDIACTAWGRVDLGQLDILVDGHTDGDRREGHHLGNGYLHDDDIHVGQT